MNTIKLYDEDSHLFEFEATVLSCEKCNGGYVTVLDKTAFFPEGGGQLSDKGTLGRHNVTDVKIKDGVIYHYTDGDYTVGATVSGTLDKNRRFTFMQNHSGEHIVSGIINSLYGFDNVGFHLGEDVVTLDFNGILDREQLDEIEDTANRKIWENVKFKAYYPSKDELAKLSYRSKKEIAGDIRIVEVENTDICACCAPHVNSACEIGIIKLLDFEKLRGGTRIYMKCGGYAIADYRRKYASVYAVSGMLSAKQDEISSAVESLNAKADGLAADNARLKSELAYRVVKDFNPENTAVFGDNFDIKQLQILVDGLHKTYGGIRAAFSQNGEGYAFALCGDEAELAEFFNSIREKLDIKGGGRNGIRQGNIFNSKEKILEYFKG